MATSRLKIWVFLLAACLILALVKFCPESITAIDISRTLEDFGIWAPLLYIFLYVLISGVVMPSIVIKILAGTLFGVFWGLVIVSIAATLSSSIKFLLARYLFRDNIQKRIEKKDSLKAIDQVIEKDGWKMLLILRNIPVINSMFLNYICALTKMPFKDFAVASFIGRLPTTIMYVYLGYFAKYTYGVGVEGVESTAAEKSVFVIGLIASIVAVLYFIHLSKRILQKKHPSFSHLV